MGSLGSGATLLQGRGRPIPCEESCPVWRLYLIRQPSSSHADKVLAVRTTSVAEEIGQTRPFAGPGQEILVTLLRTTDEVRRYLTRLVEPEDITLQQYNVLRILRGAGDGGLPTLEIGRRMLEQQPGVTRLIDRLAAKGLVDRTRGREDRRRVVCTIQPAGLATLERLDDRMGAVEDDVAAGVPPEEMASVLAALNTLRAHLRDTATSD